MIVSACISPLSWAYPVEIMNTPIGAKDTVRTSMACWIANFMIGQEMDHYFEITQWFVPLAMYEGIDAGARERELAAAGENADDGESIEHCESV
ncbi:hypothetical protein CcaverHIS002_0403930 [Cutaneotrichosporon cavernicola]|uniref:Uncharacterized protein n=1 Tax=Cutaneotrichosporon cavernicola TaxID=279322 RepID=A0AA48L435_9TREE|nr:uncharacterized protein CcaverHIS019_0403880 [Cutaneotrichosporon cavernicola]BEI83789.1 hypothetical protein CcaverHIS002_0403930 [Cutaneotrichosporon cavernicola]BEI91568.1 hypothetical protein CcaverHIS019_0403880 [Cutaneotrichosporon cavernicola]BEI99345.1 hypothetical protein CcaverHIS631_0403880 [Cutaneotrichosporon cavernicola]